MNGTNGNARHESIGNGGDGDRLTARALCRPAPLAGSRAARVAVAERQ